MRFHTLVPVLAPQYNIVVRLVMSTITILYDGDGDDAVFMRGTLLPKIEAAFSQLPHICHTRYTSRIF